MVWRHFMASKRGWSLHPLLMASYLMFQTSYSKAKNKNTMHCLRKLSSTVQHYNYHVNNEASNVLQHGFNNRTNFTQQSKKRHVATKQVPPEVLFVRSARKRDGTFYNPKRNQGVTAHGDSIWIKTLYIVTYFNWFLNLLLFNYRAWQEKVLSFSFNSFDQKT